MAVSRSKTWNDLFERFAEFQARPCLKASGPDRKRPSKSSVVKRLKRQYEADRENLPIYPCDFKQDHLNRLLQRRGITTRSGNKRPDHTSLWHGLYRAIIFERDDYCCYFCGRSGEKGIDINGEGCLALRLELDHIVPRATGGHDYKLSNIRTMCRTCNVARSRMSEKHFRAELTSLAHEISKGHSR